MYCQNEIKIKVLFTETKNNLSLVSSSIIIIKISYKFNLNLVQNKKRL